MRSSTTRVVKRSSSVRTAGSGPFISFRRPGFNAGGASSVRVKITRRERALNRQLRSRLASELSALLRETLGTARQSVDRNRLEALIARRGDPLTAGLIPLEALNNEIDAAVLNAYEEAIQDGAALGLRVAGAPGITVDAEAITAAAQRWTATTGAERLATLVRPNTVDTVTGVLQQAIAGDLTPNAAARRMSDVIGLSPRDAKALANFEARLLRQRIPIPAADTALVRATIAEDVERFRNRKISERARRIASTEMQEAIHEGERQFWVQAAERGEVNRSQMRKRWFTVQDDRVCPICEPMHGQIQKFDDNFHGGEGWQGGRPPAHLQCRCFLEISADGRF